LMLAYMSHELQRQHKNMDDIREDRDSKENWWR
jgi:hypothetical protein